MGESGMIHDFQQSLLLSQSHRLDSIWESVYRQAFPGFVNMTAYPLNGEHQHSGIDRSIQLYHGGRILVDEKWRTKSYDDILLEYISNESINTPGWVRKPLRAHYIAYAIGPKGICYLLPVLQLQKAWATHGEEWIKEHGIRRAHTKTPYSQYTTLNCPVPVKPLYNAMAKATFAYFPRVSEEQSQEWGIENTA